MTAAGSYEVVGVDTADLDVRERFDRWRDHVRNNHGALELVGHEPSGFRGSTAVQRSRRLQLVEFASDPITYVRRAGDARRDGDTTLRVLVPRAGDFRVEAAEQRLTLAPGGAAMVSMAAPFTISHGAGARAWVVSLPASSLPQPHDPRVPHVLDLRRGLGAVVAGLVRDISDERSALSEDDFHDAAESLVALLVRSALGAAEAADRSLLRAVSDLVRAHSDDPTLGPAELAARLGWSLRHVQAVLQESGTTPSGMIRAVRLERARLRLLDPALDHLGVADVAHASGFGSISAFNAAFAETYGISPRVARRDRG